MSEENEQTVEPEEIEEQEDKELFEMEKTMSRIELASLLFQLADKIEQGQLSLQYGDQSIDISIPTNVEVEFEVEERTKKGRVKKQLEIEIEWYDDEAKDDILIIK
ncbi:MAG: amphi-Trp domain-containing protein [Candidatus Hodarchaeales archaeon]|jgi:amphi-Trp domain-containing protein